MNFDDLQEFEVPGHGGIVDYQGPTKTVFGNALVAQDTQFTPDKARTRDGVVTTMLRQESADADFTGMDVLDVLGEVNPGEVPVLFDSQGNLQIETPVGSGCLTTLVPPFALPAQATGQMSQGPNQEFIAITDGVKGLAPPLRYDGQRKQVALLAQNQLGAPWQQGTFYAFGDCFRSPDGRWWNCIQSATGPASSNGPFIPLLNGYWAGGVFVPATAIDLPGGGSLWEEWTPNVTNFLPAPDLTSAFTAHSPATGGTIPAGKDVYIKLTFVIPQTGESQRSLAAVFMNTSANDRVILTFGPAGATPTLPTPRWIVAINGATSRFHGYAINIYVAAVVHGNPAPADAAYFEFADQAAPDQVVIITSIPVANVGGPYAQGAFISLATSNPPKAFFGEGGPRYLLPVRRDLSGNLVTSHPDAPVPVNLAGALKVNIIPPDNIVRDVSGEVTVWVSDITGFFVGQTVHVEGVTDPSFDGDYHVDIIVPSLVNPAPAGVLSLSGGAHVVGNSSGGIVTTDPPPPPVAFLPPAGSYIAELIAGMSVVGQSKAGPYFYISDADPAGPAGTNIITFNIQAGAFLAVVQDASMLRTGQEIIVAVAGPSDANGLAVIASIANNFVTWATKSVTNGAYVGGAINVEQTLPMSAQANPQTITKITRDPTGLVAAQVPDLTGFHVGQWVDVIGVDDGSFGGTFQLTGVVLSSDGLSGVLNWKVAPTTIATSQHGTISGGHSFPLNYTDEELSAATDNELTSQLTNIPAPFAADAYWVPSLRQMAYIDPVKSPSEWVFSNVDDVGNIDPNGGLLGIDGSASRAIAVREMRSGEILGFKVDGGYALDANEQPASDWTPTRRWKVHGPPSGAAIGIGKDFCTFPSKSGIYRYQQADIEWISPELGQEKLGFWKRVNWQAAATCWTVVNEDTLEVYYGLPLDGATTPSHILMLSYFAGWGDPEVRNRYGVLIANREGRKWSLWQIAARAATIGTRTLQAPVDCAGLQKWPITHLNRTGGVVTLTFADNTLANKPPVDAGDKLFVTSVTDPTFNGEFTVTAFQLGPATVIYNQNVADADAAGAPGDSASVGTDVPAADLTDQRTLTRQVLFARSAASAPFKWKTYNLQTLQRVGGLVTAVTTLGYDGILGDTTRVVVAGVADPSFDGIFAVQNFALQQDGTWVITWLQAAQPDGNSAGGAVSTTLHAARVVMLQPDRHDDDGDGIDWQYQGAYFQKLPKVWRFGGARGSSVGAGNINVTPKTANPQDNLPAQQIDLDADTPGTVVEWEVPFEVDTPYLSLLFDNGKEPGVYCELLAQFLYANPILSGGVG